MSKIPLKIAGSHRKAMLAPWLVLGGLVSQQTLGSMGVMSIPPLVPFLRADWHIDEVQVGLFTSALYAGAALMSITAGQLVDRYGTRRVLALGQVVVGLLVILLALAPNTSLGLLAMFVAGIGYSTSNPAGAKAIMSWFSRQLRGSAMSIKQTGVTLGSALAAAILPSLAYLTSWRTSLVFTGLLIVALAIPFYIFYRDSSEESAPPNAAGFSQGFRVVIRNRNIVLISLIGVLFSYVQLSLGTFLAIYLTANIKLSVIAAGGYLALTQAAGTVGRISWGVLSDTLFAGRRKPVLYLIGAISGIMALLLSFSSPDTPLWVISITAVVFGFCAIGYNGVYQIYIAEIAGKQLAGIAIGVSLAIAYFGIILGTPMFGYLVKATSSYKVAWISTGLAMLAAISVLSLIRERRR